LQTLKTNGGTGVTVQDNLMEDKEIKLLLLVKLLGNANLINLFPLVGWSNKREPAIE